MTTIYKYSGRNLFLNSPWTDDDGIQHPSNWGLWSDEEKAAKGITEIVLQPFPDQQLYTSEHNNDGSVNSTPKDIDVVKAHFKSQASMGLSVRLSRSDWYYIRRLDSNVAVPTTIQAWRDQLRATTVSMENAIDAAASVADIEALINEGALSAWVYYEDFLEK
jgi:hypothetical protein